jgi:hypothetical protein
MQKKRTSKSASSRHRRSAPAAVALAGVLASVPAASASAVPQITDEVLAKMSPGALRRLLLNLRHEDAATARRTPALTIAADFDSYVMHGSHSKFSSHGQHTSYSSNI